MTHGSDITKQTRTVSVMVLLLAAYVCALSVWPSYADFRITPSIGLNPSRIVLACLIGFFLLAIAQSRAYRQRLIYLARRHKTLVLATVLYGTIRVIAGLIYGARPTFIALYEVASTILLMVIAMSAVKSYRDIKFVFVSMILCLLAVGAYAALEYFVQRNFFLQFADESTKMGSTALFDKTRDGMYRAQSVFEHPLSLAQILVITAPLTYIFLRSRSWFFLAYLSLAAAIAAGLFTGTRTALAAPILAGTVLGCVSLYRRYKDGRLRFIHFIAISALIAFALLWVPRIISGSSVQQSGSTSTRVAQIQNGFLAVKNRPLIGYGPGNAASVVVSVGETNADSALMYGGSLDNLFLTKMVESGLPSILLFFFLIGYVLTGAVRQFLDSTDTRDRRLSAAIVLSITSGIASMAILSIFTVLPLLFVVMGISLSRPAHSDS